MSGKNTLVVKINGQEYTIASQESREYMLGVADLVDRKMREITQFNPTLSTTLTAVLTSLNLAEDYVRLQRETETLKKKAAAYDEHVRRTEAEGYRGRR